MPETYKPHTMQWPEVVLGAFTIIGLVLLVAAWLFPLF